MPDTLQHFLSPDSLTLEETHALFALARELKQSPLRPDLLGKSLGMVFFNPSLRTRTSFDVGMFQLGGQAVTLDVGVGTWKLEHREGQVMDGDAAEHIRDAAQVLSRYVNALAIRSFPQRLSWGEDRRDPILQAFARWATVPVINLESALHHPCQSLADLMTIEERLGNPSGQPIAITWAYHPRALPMAVPNSIVLEAAKFGMDIRLAHPPGWELDPDLMSHAQTLAHSRGGGLKVVHQLDEALPGAKVVYAKSWGSIRNYRHPEEEDRQKQTLRGRWRVGMHHMERTDDAFFMHCLPVRRGIIVEDEVLDSDRNAAYDEAENRLHVQKALLLQLLNAQTRP